MTEIPVPDGHIASVITHLEMRERPVFGQIQNSALDIGPWSKPDLHDYRGLFRKIGLPWLWLSRLVMDDADVRAIIGHDDVHVYQVTDTDNAVIGMIELDYRIEGECEIGFLGLIPAYNGKGHGRALMQWILRTVWNCQDIKRVWLHTCSFDHPGAIRFYQRSGFVPFRREVEILLDPRLTGHLPRDAGPHIPVIESR